MRRLDITLPTATENVAFDQSLLDEAESSPEPREAFRLWECPELAVIVGRSSRREIEVNLAACEADGIPIVQRPSGGCAVVIGPGCLMYSVVLSYELRPELASIDRTHQFVLGRVQQALATLISDIQYCGISDLAWQGRKFSGNSLRCKRRHLLYHGTILYDFPLDRIARYLLTPPREPDYRAARSHDDFVTNLPIAGDALRNALWQAFDFRPLNPPNV
jgi:lipoate-protein ligase A